MQSSLQPAHLQKWKLEPYKYFVIHPGMGGSALNWPLQNYAQAAKKLSLKNTVVITGGPMDAKIIAPLKKELANEKHILCLDKDLAIDELLLLLKYARVVLVPSTGVAHLAASLGTPTLGIYSPVLVERALRWGPLGKFVQTLTPEVKDDNTGEVDASIMEKISVDDVCKKIKELENEL
jgi:ADP-heptose:LPS heptosyltransferase